jgi:alpha-1,3/alpha-1,6-mannosyltransferase
MKPDSPAPTSVRTTKVVFLHLDLGIGGAEQLVLQLATASVALGHHVFLVTTRCEPHHCFAAVHPNGDLHKFLRVWGNWIPADLFGYGRTFCSTLRVMYLALCIVLHKETSSADVVVVDVLPTPLPVLATFTASSLLYYCHFPDKLLKRNNAPSLKPSLLSPKVFLTSIYRWVMNSLEAWGMLAADTIVVNSLFTRSVTFECFSSLRGRTTLPVLYPALDTTSLDAWFEVNLKSHGGAGGGRSMSKLRNRIVSLNRYERKKNLGLVLQAMDWIRQQQKKQNKHQPFQQPEIILAGGYDAQNSENVEHLKELQELASQLQLDVSFRCSISDVERAELLHTALVVVYTPSHEHFGIVPLEAMYAGTCVVAVNNGGPKESVVNEVTGLLCDGTPGAFGAAIQRLLEDPDLAISMGQAGREHVSQTFGQARLHSEWNAFVDQTIKAREQRMSVRLRSTFVVLSVLALSLVAIYVLVFVRFYE